METKEQPAKPHTVDKNGDNKLQGIGIVIWIIVQIVVLFVMLWLITVSYYTFSYYPFAFFVLGMLPSIIAIVIDRSAGRFESKTIFACNFIGISLFLFDIGFTTDTSEQSLAINQLMSVPGTWGIIYLSAFVGYVLAWIQQLYRNYSYGNKRTTGKTPPH